MKTHEPFYDDSLESAALNAVAVMSMYVNGLYPSEKEAVMSIRDAKDRLKNHLVKREKSHDRADR